MAFEIKNPTLKNIIDFLKNQLSKVATDTDISASDPNPEHWYGRRNGVWSLIQGGGGGGESTNIGDEVYTDGNNLIIKSASTEVKDFFGQIANDFSDALSYSTGNLVMYNKELYRFTSDYIAGSGDSLTTHAVTTTIDMGLQQKANTTYVNEITNKLEVLKYTASGIADNKRTFSVTGLEDDMVPLVMDLSNPSAQTGSWTISTTTGSFTITGSITGNTNADFYFMKTR